MTSLMQINTRQRGETYITWASASDSGGRAVGGSTVARGIGPGAAVIESAIDSTTIHIALCLGLFGERR